ncbi:hypothetical protein BBP13_09455 [Limosilactobacillus reuteri]|uniref:hypothetical protein n=1 Tax=Limosilactobacillus reuteri TaxID=1598 RepID=UPI00081BF646|nr:hypothetical protein [Limosilactobacillus reuteri]OCW67437.1 hypothetical protein BBP13_09455 [Limosilactobacillus reuteri]
MQEANVLGASFMDKFVYAHIWGFGIVALVVLMLLLVYVGVRTWRKYHSVSKISLGITAGIYLAIVLPFLMNVGRKSRDFSHGMDRPLQAR